MHWDISAVLRYDLHTIALNNLLAGQYLRILGKRDVTNIIVDKFQV